MGEWQKIVEAAGAALDGEAMAHTFTSVLLHIVFSTKDRRAILHRDLQERLFPYMGGIIRELKSKSLIVNGMEDHVHILASLASTISLADFMRELKGVSSGWVNEKLGRSERFGWQTGYAAFSVSKSNQEAVREYIAQQREHHHRLSFQEEYLQFLKRHEIEFDPRFVFEGEFAG